MNWSIVCSFPPRKRKNCFPPRPKTEAGELLGRTLERNVPLALSMGTEKARAELIIAPILVEVWERAQGQAGLFSGVDFNVDEARGLTGNWDFLFSQSREQFFVSAPILAVRNARHEDLVAGMGQCGAAMVAARLFNERRMNNIPVLYGAVTTGDVWRFLCLEGSTLFVDRTVYYLDRLDTILGILYQIVVGTEADPESELYEDEGGLSVATVPNMRPRPRPAKKPLRRVSHLIRPRQRPLPP